MNASPDRDNPEPNAEEPGAVATPNRKRWKLLSAKSAFPWLVSATSTAVLLISNTEKITMFARAHLPGGLVRQFPFTMQISSTLGAGSQPSPYYREEHIQEGTLIRPVRNHEFGLPTLDFHIVNNSSDVTFVRDLVLKVANSQPDNRPVLTWEQLNLADGDKPFTITNEGWGAALDAKIVDVKGTLVTKTGAKKTSPTFEIPLGKIGMTAETSLERLVQKPFELEKLSEVKSGRLAGTLTYSYIDPTGSQTSVATAFSTRIRNAVEEPPPPGEGPGKDEHQFLQVLDTNRQNYSVSCSVGQNLELKKAYRFAVTLCSKQSAIHDFDVIVTLSNGATIKLGHYRLEFYLPRTDAPLLAEVLAKPNSLRFTSVGGPDEALPGVDDEESSEPTGSTKVAAEYPDEPVSPSTGPGGEDPATAEKRETAPDIETSQAAVLPVDSKPLKATYPYGIPVPGHPDVVGSPFLSGKYIDVTGFDHKTLVEDPYVHQLFLVP
jgi:hypothetical protein